MTQEMYLIGHRLVAAGLITEEQLEEAIHHWEEDPSKRITQYLVELGFTTSRAINRTLAAQSGLRFIEDEDLDPDPVAVAMVPRELAEKYRFVPLEYHDNVLSIAMVDPRNVRALDDIRLLLGYSIEASMASPDAIDYAINASFSSTSALDMSVDLDGIDAPETLELSDTKELTADSPTVKLVNYIIQKSVADDASDIHFEPQENDLLIRYRVDGVLQEVMRSPRSSQAAIISRLKIMADIDISETRKPQDGHCALTVGRKKVDFRVSSLPTVYGERVVLRILRTDNVVMKLQDLGFSEYNLRLFETAFRKPYGTILVTGPTGSGKSTSLYAAINVLNHPTRHILTAEDPVEYRLPGINQTQINTRAGLTFARALRSFLRCSPDVILVGEIRDQETAQIATEAALTGHLVLSTLHTNDAPSAITRLTEMGVEPFLVSSAIETIIAQRLARRLCSECKEPYTPDHEAMIRVGYRADNIPKTLYRAVGCKKCNNTGYKGRTGIHEVLTMSEAIGKLCVESATGDAIRQQAIGEGMQTLRMDGLEKVRDGLTSIEELLRVIV